MTIGGGTTFTFAQLGAGLGGFHAALAAVGGRPVLAVEPDATARRAYEAAWVVGVRHAPHASATGATGWPEHDVLGAALAPEAFQAGHARPADGGVAVLLGVLEAARPKVVVVETSRVVGEAARRGDVASVVARIRRRGYAVEGPVVASPHRVAPQLGGTPLDRPRAYLVALRSDLVQRTRREAWTGPDGAGWDADEWRIDRTPLVTAGGRPAVVRGAHVDPRFRLAPDGPEMTWLAAYQRFVRGVERERALSRGDGEARLPGFPLVFDARSGASAASGGAPAGPQIAPRSPRQASVLTKNRAFARRHAALVQELSAQVAAFPPNRRRLEWYADDASSVWECLVELRSTAIRVAPPTWTTPILTPTRAPIYGPEWRRIVPVEAARLHGFGQGVEDAIAPLDDRVAYRLLAGSVHPGLTRLVLASALAHHEPVLTAAGRTALSGLLAGVLGTI